MTADYFTRPGISATAIKSGAVSMKRMRHVITNGIEPTKAMEWGTLVHDVILGKSDDYLVWPNIRRGKDWDAFKTANPGKTIIIPSEEEALKGKYGIANAVLSAHGKTIRLWEYERALFWDEPGIGPSKGKPDAFGGGGLLDLKVCASIDERKVNLNSWQMGYHLQLAWYMRGLKANGIETARAGLLCVESKPPFDSRIYWADPVLLEFANKECLRIAGEYVLACERREFPGQYVYDGQLIQPAFADEIVQGVPDDELDVSEL